VRMMSKINIAGAIDELLIFDDPYYCNENDKVRCIQLNNQEYNTSKPFCPVFFKYLRDKLTKEFEERGCRIAKLEKCDQCKSAYQKAKQQQKKQVIKMSENLKDQMKRPMNFFEAFGIACDEDFLVFETDGISYSIKKNYVKKTKINGDLIISNGWVIVKIIPDPIGPIAIADLIEPEENTFDYGVKCAEKGIENGRLEEWQRPEQVELRGAIENYFNCKFGEQSSITRVKKALENLKPPYED
jgi:hypothetical protein